MPIIGAPQICLRYSIRCYVSKLEYLRAKFFTIMHPLYKLGEIWAKFTCQYLGLSFTLPKLVLSFRHVTPFESVSTTAIKSEDKVSDFFVPPSAKIRGKVDKMSELFFRARPRSQPMINF